MWRVSVDECEFQRQPRFVVNACHTSEFVLVNMNVSWFALEKVLFLYASGDSSLSMPNSIITGMQRYMDQWADLCSFAPSQPVPPKHPNHRTSCRLGRRQTQKEKAVGWVDMVVLLDSGLSRPASDTGG